MKIFLRGLGVALAVIAMNPCLAQEAAPQEKAQKETFYVVKITTLDKGASCQVLNKAELAEMQKKLKYESMVMGQAYKAVSTEWTKPDADGKKGPPFPLSGMPPARSLRVIGQFSDSTKANQLLEKENKKCDEAQAKLDKVANAKKEKLSEAKKKKADEKDMEQSSALDKLQKKIEELAWQKETEAAGQQGGDAAKAKE